jgi:uncharacterized repeat protein (TIGR03803 family)
MKILRIACAVGGFLSLVLSLSAQTLTTLHSFDITDGEDPVAGLIQATDGNFYGTTEIGGANGYGSVFKITPTGKLTTLYSFCSQSGCADGERPYGVLVQATNGDFYGTTFFGGANCTEGACGTVFKITPSGTLTTVYSFCSQSGCTDGSLPLGTLIQATNGDLYGTTETGGAGNNGGTIFKITPSGVLTTLYSFCTQTNCPDGAEPYAGLVQAANGYFYGTTEYGGTEYIGAGTVFKITPTGTLTTIYSFCSLGGFCTDGQSPTGTLVQATNGSFYGTTVLGGASVAGTVFKITPSGTLTTLHTFDVTDGANSSAGLLQATNGNLYGTTEDGGVNGFGTVFRLSVGLGPFVETQPTSGKVGAAVKILGTKLTGATSVSFNGTAATFTVVSSSEITTTLPVGATTGKVQVTTPSGTLSSNVSFRVTS